MIFFTLFLLRNCLTFSYRKKDVIASRFDTQFFYCWFGTVISQIRRISFIWKKEQSEGKSQLLTEQIGTWWSSLRLATRTVFLSSNCVVMMTVRQTVTHTRHMHVRTHTHVFLLPPGVSLDTQEKVSKNVRKMRLSGHSLAFPTTVKTTFLCW